MKNKGFLSFLLNFFAIICFVLFFCKCNKSVLEKMTSESETSKSLSKNSHNPSKDTMSETISILNDPQFGDLIVYNNDINPYATGETNGVKKCIKNCRGTCVEFGITGIAVCFPSH